MARKPTVPKGMRRGLTSYGDPGFSIFLRKAFIKESLIQSEIPCGTGTCRPKSNNLAITQVIDFEAR